MPGDTFGSHYGPFGRDLFGEERRPTAAERRHFNWYGKHMRFHAISAKYDLHTHLSVLRNSNQSNQIFVEQIHVVQKVCFLRDNMCVREGITF